MIRDQKGLEKKLHAIEKDGPNQFEILTDFDQTLTRYFYLQEQQQMTLKADSSFKAISDSQYIPEDAKEKNRQLYRKYSPIEKNPDISHSEKSNMMQAWWEQNMESFVKSRMRRADYGKVVMSSKLLFRHGIADLLKMSAQLSVPLTVVSGGIKEIIQASFYAIFFNGEVSDEQVRQYFLDHERVRIIANTFEYHDDIAVDYLKPIIHSMNK